MTLGEKVRGLRHVEGELRGHEMSQQDVVDAIRRELGTSFSQSYLSQVESGARPHLTHRTRQMLARFFRVHPGYLVNDPPGFHRELTSGLRTAEGPLDEWLREGAGRFAGDRALHNALVGLAEHEDSRKCLVLVGAILETPHLVDRLFDALAPPEAGQSNTALARRSPLPQARRPDAEPR